MIDLNEILAEFARRLAETGSMDQALMACYATAYEKGLEDAVRDPVADPWCPGWDRRDSGV